MSLNTSIWKNQKSRFRGVFRGKVTDVYCKGPSIYYLTKKIRLTPPRPLSHRSSLNYCFWPPPHTHTAATPPQWMLTKIQRLRRWSPLHIFLTESSPFRRINRLTPPDGEMVNGRSLSVYCKKAKKVKERPEDARQIPCCLKITHPLLTSDVFFFKVMIGT